MKSRLSIGFVSLGCPKNLVDTEAMMVALGDEVTLTSDQNQADIVVINTCGFLEPAKLESMTSISEFAKKKKSAELQALIVAGCMTERYLQPMKDAFPEVDAFIRTGEFSKIKELVQQITAKDSSLRQELLGEGDSEEVEQLKGHSEIHDYVKRLPIQRSYAYVKISEGCNRVCSFCIIPKLRGKHHSRSVEGIVDEVQQLVAHGTKELVFIAQDLTSYGRDLKNSTDLLRLLKAVDAIDAEFWYRLMYNYPRFFTDELIDHLAQSTKFTGYVDMPLQHINDEILRAMKRPESSKEIRSLVQKLQSSVPGLTLRTTMMVGFPGETEEQFEDLLNFVSEGHFDQLGAFTFFAEPGTPAFDLPGQVDEEIKQSRYRRLMEAQRLVVERKRSEWISLQEIVVIDSLAERSRQGLVYRARSRAQCPEIDGLTYVLSDRNLAAGDVVEVEFQKPIGDYDLLAVDVESQVEDAELNQASL